MTTIKPFQFGINDFEVVDKQRSFDGFFKVDTYQIRHKKYQGGWSDSFSREVFERGDAVMVMPYDPVSDCLVFNEQFRPGAIRALSSPWLLEFVAGMFGKNEDPIDVAIREAEEEANLRLNRDKIEPVMRYLSSPGGCSEMLHIYAACVDASQAGGVFGLDDEQEDIAIFKVTRTQALSWLAEGKISNAATIIALQWLAMNYQQLQLKWNA